MSHEHAQPGNNRNGDSGNSGGAFVIGLLAGTVLGAGIGMLFAPKAGSRLRRELSKHAGNLADTAMDAASDTYKRAASAAGL